MSLATRAWAQGMAACLAAWLLVACAGAPAVETAPPHTTFTMQSEALGELRRINVYLPPGHAPGRRYPVLYMPDGGIAEDFPHVAQTVDAAIREGRMAPVMVVGIENTQRRRDMTGPTAVAEDREIAPVVGGSARFRAFIADELIPRIEAGYPAELLDMQHCHGCFLRAVPRPARGRRPSRPGRRRSGPWDRPERA